MNCIKEGSHLLYEKIDELCKLNNTTITALCKELTGSTGNLSTWKKDNIKGEIIAKICIKFNVSADYLLGLTLDNSKTDILHLSEDEMDLIDCFRTLEKGEQWIIKGKISEMIYNKNTTPQKSTNNAPTNSNVLHQVKK